MIDRLFVYGSLQPGGSNESVLAPYEGVWEQAHVKGHLQNEGWGSAQGYPGLILDVEGKTVWGYLFTSQDLTANWELLDTFEGSEYERVLANVMLRSGEHVQAYVYVLSRSLEIHSLELISVEIARRYEKMTYLISHLLPYADIQHIGSTSVPGSLTKGDLDIAVMVSNSDFDNALSTLDAKMHRHLASHSDEQYQPFLYDLEGHEVGVQVFIRGSIYEKRFLEWRDALLSNSRLLERYNALKREYIGKPMTEYRKAKSEFIRHHLNEEA